MAEGTHDIEMLTDAQSQKRGARLSVSEARCTRWCDIIGIAKRVGKAAAQQAPVDTGRTKKTSV